MEKSELNKYILKFHSLVKSELLSENLITSEIVIDYYPKSAFYYKKFHSSGGAMHLPISFSNVVSHEEKLHYQAKSIEKVILEKGYVNILELGCGMGFNTNYLAKRNSEIYFHGIDLTQSNISFAEQQSRGLNNVKFSQADFDDPQSYEDKYDLVFAVETLCHSKNLHDLIERVANKINDNGRLIIFDGYVKQNKEQLSDNIDIQAYKILTWGFALGKFKNLSEMVNPQNFSCLALESSKEYSENVLPNLITFQKGAKKALRHSFILRVLLRIKIISLAFIKQLGAGLTAPYFIKNNYVGYYKLEFKKTAPINTDEQ